MNLNKKVDLMIFAQKPHSTPCGRRNERLIQHIYLDGSELDDSSIYYPIITSISPQKHALLLLLLTSTPKYGKD